LKSKYICCVDVIDNYFVIYTTNKKTVQDKIP